MIDRGWVTPLDARLLAALARTPNLVQAARALGIGRDRAVYRLLRLRRIYGGPAARGRRGGRSPGATELTVLGRRLMKRPGVPRRPANIYRGVYRAGVSPQVEIGPHQRLEVAFGARDGSFVVVEIDREAFVVALRPAELSARNALPVTVETTRVLRSGAVELRADWEGRPVRVALTRGSVRRLRLVPGTRAFLYVKAVAVRRSPTRGSRRR